MTKETKKIRNFEVVEDKYRGLHFASYDAEGDRVVYLECWPDPYGEFPAGDTIADYVKSIVIDGEIPEKDFCKNLDGTDWYSINFDDDDDDADNDFDDDIDDADADHDEDEVDDEDDDDDFPTPQDYYDRIIDWWHDCWVIADQDGLYPCSMSVSGLAAFGLVWETEDGDYLDLPEEMSWDEYFASNSFKAVIGK